MNQMWILYKYLLTHTQTHKQHFVQYVFRFYYVYSLYTIDYFQCIDFAIKLTMDLFKLKLTCVCLMHNSYYQYNIKLNKIFKMGIEEIQRNLMLKMLWCLYWENYFSVIFAILLCHIIHNICVKISHLQPLTFDIKFHEGSGNSQKILLRLSGKFLCLVGDLCFFIP